LEAKQFKSNFQEKEDFRTFSHFTALYRPANYSPSYNGIKDENRNEIEVKVRLLLILKKQSL
tara:strand:+ start:384 stop:569 length:186 start_codon:yes stop_codon:yes gene_type:complete